MAAYLYVESLFSLLSVLIIGILGWLYWDSNNEKPIPTQNTNESPQIERPKVDKNTVEFKIIDSTNINEKRYGIIKPDSLQSYEFIYTKTGWSFINKTGKNKVSYVRYNPEGLKHIYFCLFCDEEWKTS
jgi:hypothetical protein